MKVTESLAQEIIKEVIWQGIIAKIMTAGVWYRGGSLGQPFIRFDIRCILFVPQLMVTGTKIPAVIYHRGNKHMTSGPDIEAQP